jgi:hypothetical protein
MALPRSRRLGLNRSSASPRRGREKAIFWDTLFGSYPSWREEKVLEYVAHRLGDGAHLRDVMQEEYVRRLVSPDEVEEILGNPRLIEAARKKMKEDLSSGRLVLRKPTRRVDGTVAEWLPKRP